MNKKPIHLRMSADEKRGLKSKHRLEIIMQEMGERFEQDKKRPDVWRSITTPGLIVNTKRQVFDHADQSGDVFTWLMKRYSWTFPQAIRYLQKRIADPIQDVKPTTATPAQVASYTLKRYESETPDLEKESSGLYEHGVKHAHGKMIHVYLPKPFDTWQARAMEINGEKMRNYFSWKSSELARVRDSQWTRFMPIQDLRINYCEECDEEIPWHWKQKPEIIRYPVKDGWRKVRVFQPEVFAYAVHEDGEEVMIICADCKRKHENFYQALDLLYKSAYRREAPEREHAWQEEQDRNRRIYEAELAREQEEEKEFYDMLALQA